MQSPRVCVCARACDLFDSCSWGGGSSSLHILINACICLLTGHAAMETAACNLIEPKDVVLSVCTGIWGERFADMAERQGAKVVKITKEQGQVFSNQELEQVCLVCEATP